MCPYYMNYGMTLDEYWNGDPYTAVYYREKHKLDIESRNQEMWLQGLYIFNAVLVAINNGINGGHEKYISKPLELFPKTDEQKQAEIEKTRKAFAEQLDSMMAAWNKKHEAEQSK